ncbi:MAG: WD40 repeat domain-containing protein [Gemmataceae bacterium]
MNRLTWFAIAFLAFLLPSAATADPLANEDFRVLIAELGDRAFSKRERAMQTLESIGEPALPALRESAKLHPTLEVRRRSAILVGRIEVKIYGEIDRLDGMPAGGKMQLKLSRDGKTMLVSSYRDVYVWDLEARKVRWKWEGHLDEVQDMDFTHDGKHVVVGCGSVSGADFGIRIWNLETGKQRSLLKGHTGWVHGVACAPLKPLLLSASHDGSMKLWDLDKEETLQTIRETSLDGRLSFTRSAEWSPDGKYWACHNSYGVFVWDAETGKDLHKLHSMKGKIGALGQPVTKLRFSPNSKLLAIGGGYPTMSAVRAKREDDKLTLWDVDKGTKTMTLKGHALQVSGLSFSPDSRRLATCALDNTMRIWNVDSEAEIRTYHMPSVHINGVDVPGQCYSVEVARDGRSAYIACRDGVVRRFRLPD